jgi:predicted transcriptional regulator
VKTKLSKADMTARNKQIFEMRKSGFTQSEIAESFGVSTPRIGQILSNYKKPYKSMKKKALLVIEEVTNKKQSNTDLVSAILKCDMDDAAKLELLKNFF